MKRLLVTSILILTQLVACSYGPFAKDNDPQDPVDAYDTSHLKATYDFYTSVCDAATDNGIVGYGDALLFSALSLVGGCDVNLFAFESEEDGRWCRHPDCPGPEYPEGSKKLKASKFSKDMEIGFILGMFHYWTKGTEEQKRLAIEAVNRHIAYGQAHSWDMCGEDGAMDEKTRLSRCVMSSNTKATLYELRYQMGGEDNIQRKIAQAWDPLCTGFRCHLTVIHWLVRGSLQDGINDLQKKFLLAKAEKHRDNALYQMAYNYFTDGKFVNAYTGLANTEYFPEARLPTSEDRCVDYLYQRDKYRSEKFTADSEGCIYFLDPAADHREMDECELTPEKEYTRKSFNKDYLPCAEKNEIHSATDFRFTWAVSQGALKIK